MDIGVGLPTPAGRDMLGRHLQQATEEGDEMTQREKFFPYPVRILVRFQVYRFFRHPWYLVVRDPPRHRLQDF